MRNSVFIPYVLFFFFLSQGVLVGNSCIQKEFDLVEQEKYLKTAKVTAIEIKDSEGRTAPWEVTLDDGKTQRRGRFKYVRRSRPHHLPDSYHYEIAAYELTKLLGIQVIPPVIEREIDDMMGSLQMFVEGCFRLSDQKRKGMEPPDHGAFRNSLQELAVLENLTYCERNKKDILVNEKTWHVCRVDFSEAFAPEMALIPGSDISRCSRTLFKGLLNLDGDDVRSKLGNHLNDEELKALLKRKNLVLERLKSLIAEKGEKEVLF
jgi:hypothetical protein